MDEENTQKSHNRTFNKNEVPFHSITLLKVKQLRRLMEVRKAEVLYDWARYA